MKKYIVEFLQCFVIAAIIGGPFVLYFAQMKPWDWLLDYISQCDLTGNFAKPLFLQEPKNDHY